MTSSSFNNPGVTAPASQQVGPPRSQSLQLTASIDGSFVPSSPAGEVGNNAVGENDFGPEVTKYDVGWRRIVRNFTPSWFSVTMGTGIVGVLLSSIPFPADWLYYLSIVFFVLNTILFALAFTVSFLRYTLYPPIWGVMIRDPTNSLFLACAPMGFATLIRLWVDICVPAWGAWAVTFAWVLWMLDSVASAAATTFLSFTMMSQESLTSLSRITAAQLLPIAATIVAAGTGSVVADILPNPQHVLGTVITCYVMWGMSVPLSITVIVMYYQRLAVHKLPSREVIVSCFLPLGPLGYGGFAILRLGKTCMRIFPVTNSLPAADNLAGPVLYTVGFLTALFMWGFGIIWLIFALATIWKSRPIPFNMGWWGFTFPLGVFAGSTIQIGIELPSIAFKIFGTIFSCAVIALWIVVAIGTARGAWSGQLFYAPCLANLKRREDEKNAARSKTTDEETAGPGKVD